jgi:hypothetical protein
VLHESAFCDSLYLECTIFLDVPEKSACEVVGCFLLLVVRLVEEVLFD